MIQLQIKSLTILILLSTFSALSQDRYKGIYKCKILFGVNIIDDSFSLGKDLFDVKNKYNIVPYPSYFGASYQLNDDFTIESTISLNNYKVGKLVDGERITKEMRYYAVDSNFKYDFSNLDWNYQIIPQLNPYLLAGMGITSIDDKIRATVNYGIGTYFWFELFSDKEYDESILYNIGIVIQIQGKSSFEQKIFGNQLEHSLAIVYRFQ
jgi:OmpA-OmpF porin, OOP family